MGGACGGCCDDRGLKLGSSAEDDTPVKMLKSKKTKQVGQPK